MNMRSEGGERGNWNSSQIFEEINSWLDQVAGEDLAALSAESMGDDLVALRRIESRVQSETLRRLRRFGSGEGYAFSGARSAQAWLRLRRNLPDNARKKPG